MDRAYFVYIMTNKKEGTFYIGVTNNLPFRVWQHKNGLGGSKYVQRYNLFSLVYYTPFNDISEAIKLEKKLKRWKKKWKIELIEEQNPEWKDLYYDLNN